MEYSDNIKTVFYHRANKNLTQIWQNTPRIKNSTMKNKIIIATILAAVLGAAANLHAQDKQTLDLLVSKGLITRAEADSVAKKTAAVSPKEKTVKSLKVEGRLQTQYEYLSNNDGNTDPRSTFLMRRIFLGIGADLGAGWKADIVADFANAKGNYLEKAYISKKFDYDFLNGTADIGYRKTNFAVEEYTSSSKLLSIERSLATRYFAEGNDGRKLGIAGRHTGVFWNGNLSDKIDGLTYGIAVSTAYNNSPTGTPTDYTNGLMYTANVAYKTKIEGAKLEVGANAAYTNGMNVIGSKGYRYGEVIAFNPYVKTSVMGVDIWGEFLLANVENGVSNGKDATPMGANIGAEYKFDIGELGKIAPTVRLSWLDTDGRGVKISDGVRDSNAANTFDSGESIYVGLNWYLQGNAVKYQIGYEYARFEGGYSASQRTADASAFRTQLQILF